MPLLVHGNELLGILEVGGGDKEGSVQKRVSAPRDQLIGEWTRGVAGYLPHHRMVKQCPRAPHLGSEISADCLTRPQ